MLFIYKRLKKDFKFIESYGFRYICHLKSNIAPGVYYKKGEESLGVGFDYVEGEFYCLYNRNGSAHYCEPLKKAGHNIQSYNRQVAKAKETIETFLKELGHHI